MPNSQSTFSGDTVLSFFWRFLLIYFSTSIFRAYVESQYSVLHMYSIDTPALYTIYGVLWFVYDYWYNVQLEYFRRFFVRTRFYRYTFLTTTRIHLLYGVLGIVHAYTCCMVCLVLYKYYCYIVLWYDEILLCIDTRPNAETQSLLM